MWVVVVAIFFKWYKWLVHVVSGTSELERISAKHHVTRRAVALVDQSLALSTKLVAQRKLLLLAAAPDHGDGDGGAADQEEEEEEGDLISDLAGDIVRLKGFRSTQAADAFHRIYRCLYHANGAVNYLEQLAKVPFEGENGNQEQAEVNRMRLLGLWKALNPDSTVPPLVSPLWKEVGFQGNSPATDFRGMGMLGLENLAHFADHHGELARSVLLTSQHPTQWFPFAATGINITSWLLGRAKDHHLHHLFCLGDIEAGLSTANVDCFGEIYSATYTGFQRFWVSEKGQITEFPVVFAKFKQTWTPCLDEAMTLEDLFL